MSPLDRIANVSILKVPRGLGRVAARCLRCLPTPRPLSAAARGGQAVQGGEPAGHQRQRPVSPLLRWHWGCRAGLRPTPQPGQARGVRGSGGKRQGAGGGAGASSSPGFVSAGLDRSHSRAAEGTGRAQGASHSPPSLCDGRFCFLVRPRIKTMRYIAGECKRLRGSCPSPAVDG